MKERFRQFICSPGYRLSEEEEETLISVCLDHSARIDRNLLMDVIDEYDTLFPDTNIRLYKKRPLLSVLHMYTCMFYGIRELLFKAHHPFLAAEIHRAEGINLFPVLAMGTPVDLFEKGVTNRLLKLLDTEWGVQELMTEENRQITIRTYGLYNRKLGGYSSISHSQWRYLKACAKGKEEFDLQKLRIFRRDDTDRLYQDYIIFIAKQRLINRYMEWIKEVSDPEQLYKGMEEADHLLIYVMNRDRYDALMEEQKNRLVYLDYEDSEYIVTHPCSVQDIYEEGSQQHNCLMTLFRGICNGNMDVGFMRAKESPQKSLVTFEVSRDSGEVLQVYGKCNQILDDSSQERKWFENVYMKEKGFTYTTAPDFPGGQYLGDPEDIPF